MMNEQDKVEPTVQEEQKPEPKHYGMQVDPGKFVIKLVPEPEEKDEGS